MYKTKIFLSMVIVLSISFVYLLLLEQGYEDKVIQQKKIFIAITSLPDIALSTENIYIRHRSLSDTFHIFKDGPTLLTYTPSNFTISYSHIKDKNED